MPSGVSKWEDPVTNLDAVEAETDGSWVEVGTADIIRVLVTSDNSADGVVAVEGNTLASGAGDTVTLWSDTIATDTVTRLEFTDTDLCPLMRVAVTTYSAGDFTATVARHV